MWRAIWILISMASALSGAVADDRVSAVLAKARIASGWPERGAVAVLIEDGTETESGLTGHWRDKIDLGSGWIRQDEDFHVFRDSEVLNENGDWRQDPSGGVHVLNSTFAVEHTTTQTWLAKRGYLRSDLSGAKVNYGGQRNEKGLSFDVLLATPGGGQLVELWFDRKTGLLDRSISQMPVYTEIIHYGDYRPVDGLLVPFKRVIAGSIEPASITIDHAEISAEHSAREFAPPRAPLDWSIEGGVATVPISFDSFDGDVVFDARLNGHGPFSFILDTGGHDIITPEIAKALHLRTEGAGESGGAGEGTLSQQYTRIEHVDIGGVSLLDQPFYVIPEQYNTVERGPNPPLAGIMGLELFERFAMRIDYQRRTLTFRPLAGIPEGHGIRVPIFFSDDIPLFKAKIAGIEGDNALDTGNAGTLVLQWRWADAHGLGQRMRKGYLAAGFGSGGISKTWISRLDLNVAGLDFPQTLASMSQDTLGAFSSRTEAGNIGNDILANFTLDFDYARNVVWFDPGTRLPPLPFGRAGASVYKSSPGAFTVATVAPGTPAADAGLVANDDIVAIDGVSATQLSVSDFRRIVRQPPGTKLALELVRQGKKRRIFIVLRDLLPSR